MVTASLLVLPTETMRKSCLACSVEQQTRLQTEKK
jgi:hypothetical protein